MGQFFLAGAPPPFGDGGAGSPSNTKSPHDENIMSASAMQGGFNKNKYNNNTLYTVSQKKLPPLNCLQLCQILTDFKIFLHY